MPTSSITKYFFCNPEVLKKLIDNLDNYNPPAKKKDKNKLSSLEYGKEKLQKLSYL